MISSGASSVSKHTAVSGQRITSRNIQQRLPGGTEEDTRLTQQFMRTDAHNLSIVEGIAVADTRKQDMNEYKFESEDDQADGGWASDPEGHDEIDELARFVDPRSADAMSGLYGTSMPKASFFGVNIPHGNPMSSRAYKIKYSPNLSDPQSFATAQSSFASYLTAPSKPSSALNTAISRAGRRAFNSAKSQLAQSSSVPFHARFEGLVSEVFHEALFNLTPPHLAQGPFDQLKSDIRVQIHSALSPLQNFPSSVPSFEYGPFRNCRVDDVLDQFISQLADWYISGDKVFDLGGHFQRNRFKKAISPHVSEFLPGYTLPPEDVLPGGVFSSEWLSYLQSRGILLDPSQELDWSGKGQHVEYEPDEERNIPLKSERILGHSNTAIIDSVRCRRIMLARKKITCNRRLKREDAVDEVRHLLQLQHSHVIRVVGTYTLGKELAILLYPAAQCDLDRFMDEIGTENTSRVYDNLDREFEERRPQLDALLTFFGCLSKAICFIHRHNIKHMDIKPKNLLVRKFSSWEYKVYIADFGIARSYTSATDAETDSPISYTRDYAAPEVVLQTTRGFSADVFSLGCVFAEMVAVMTSGWWADGRQRLLDYRLLLSSSGNSSFSANIEAVRKWFKELRSITWQDNWAGNDRWGAPSTYRVWRGRSPLFPEHGWDLISDMMDADPGRRPTADKLRIRFKDLACSNCDDGPEPFEAATAISTDAPRWSFV